jgi:tetratricopeptide (TPR) repeat protein
MSAESSLLRPIPLRAEASDVAAVSALLGGMAFGALRLRRDWTAGVLLVAGALACAAGVTLNAVGAARWELLPDRYASLGLIGVGLAAGGAFATVPMLRRRAASFAVGALLLSLAVRDAAEARRWRDDISLFSWEFSVWPDQPQAAFYLAHALAEAGRWGDALPRAEDAVRLGPDLPQTWEVLAVVRHGLGDRDGARAVLQEGLSRLPGDARLQEAMARWEAAR